MKTQLKDDLLFAMKLAQQKLSIYCAVMFPTLGMLLFSAPIHDLCRKLRSFRKWGKGMDINPENEALYITQYQEAFLNYVENQYSAKHRCD